MACHCGHECRLHASCSCQRQDLEHTPMKESAHALDTCDGFLIGSSTFGGNMAAQVKEALGVVLSRNWQHKLPCGGSARMVGAGRHLMSSRSGSRTQVSQWHRPEPLQIGPTRISSNAAKRMGCACHRSGTRCFSRGNEAAHGMCGRRGCQGERPCQGCFRQNDDLPVHLDLSRRLGEGHCDACVLVDQASFRAQG